MDQSPVTAPDSTLPGTTLSEDLLLLCALPGDGRLRQPGNFALALAGGALFELLDAGVATFDGKRLVLLHPEPSDHPALAAAVAALARFAGPPRGARLRTCLSRVEGPVARPYLDSLVARGLAQRRTRRLLGLIPVSWYVLTPDGAAVRAARFAEFTAAAADIPAEVVGAAGLPARSFRLAALTHAGGLADRFYPGPIADRHVRRRLAALTRLDPVASAVRDAVSSANSSD